MKNNSWREISEGMIATVAEVLGCDPEDIEVYFDNVEVDNGTREEYKEVFGKDPDDDYPLGWCDRKHWEDYIRKHPDGYWLEWEDVVWECTDDSENNKMRLKTKQSVENKQHIFVYSRISCGEELNQDVLATFNDKKDALYFMQKDYHEVKGTLGGYKITLDNDYFSSGEWEIAVEDIGVPGGEVSFRGIVQKVEVN